MSWPKERPFRSNDAIISLSLSILRKTNLKLFFPIYFKDYLISLNLSSPNPSMNKFILPLLLISISAFGRSNLRLEIDKRANAVESKVIDWRRDFHQHPELGNKEVRTAKIVAEHLRSLGMEVTEQVAVTGVIGIVRGGKPGPMPSPNCILPL
jgi:hypothetical protein